MALKTLPLPLWRVSSRRGWILVRAANAAAARSIIEASTGARLVRS
jgi:hypothetical protein